MTKRKEELTEDKLKQITGGTVFDVPGGPTKDGEGIYNYHIYDTPNDQNMERKKEEFIEKFKNQI